MNISEFKKLKIIGDISCDVNGSIPTTIRSTSIEKPYYSIDIDSMKELPKVVAGTPVGKSVPLVILRNSKKITLNVVLGELELAEKGNLINKSIDNKNSKSKTFDKLGFVAEELTKSNKDKFKLKNIRRIK